MKGNLIIHNLQSRQEIESEGYFVTPFISETEIKRLREVFYTYFKDDDISTIFDSLNGADAVTRKKINEGILDICGAAINNIVANYKVVIAMYFVKKSEENSTVGRHVDPSMTLEGYHHMGFWIPLIDVNEQTGRFFVLRGSHHFTPPYYSLSVPHPYAKIDYLVKDNMSGIEVKAGEALIFDNRLLHYTAKNFSGETRIAVVIKLIDENAPLVNAFFDGNMPEGTIELYRSNDNYYLSDDFRKIEKPCSSSLIAELSPKPTQLNEDDFEKLVKEHPPLTTPQ